MCGKRIEVVVEVVWFADSARDGGYRHLLHTQVMVTVASQPIFCLAKRYKCIAPPGYRVKEPVYYCLASCLFIIRIYHVYVTFARTVLWEKLSYALIMRQSITHYIGQAE